MKPPLLVDAFGRVADDLRISVTDRCNFRCVYCMPAEGLPWLPKASVLQIDEIERITGIFLSLGIKTIRFTGGEPTLRKDLVQIVAAVRKIAPSADLAMTTNGYLFEELAAPLADAGLQRVNVSVDSLMAHRFAEITRRDALDKVFRGLRAAHDAGLGPIKLNCVVVRGRNDDELVDFAELSRQTGYQVRFIEFMPLDAQGGWSRDQVVTQDEILNTLSSRFELVPVEGASEPASIWRFGDGSPGGIGVIASVSHPFCESCNRLRLTADGQFRTCLFSAGETDLRSMIREGSSDDDIAAAIVAAVDVKQAGHRINEADFARPSRPMSMIGG